MFCSPVIPKQRVPGPSHKAKQLAWKYGRGAAWLDMGLRVGGWSRYIDFIRIYTYMVYLYTVYIFFEQLMTFSIITLRGVAEAPSGEML